MYCLVKGLVAQWLQCSSSPAPLCLPTKVAGCWFVAHVVSLFPPIRGSCSGRQPKVVVGPDLRCGPRGEARFGGFLTGMAGVFSA